MERMHEQSPWGVRWVEALAPHPQQQQFLLPLLVQLLVPLLVHPLSSDLIPLNPRS